MNYLESLIFEKAYAQSWADFSGIFTFDTSTGIGGDNLIRFVVNTLFSVAGLVAFIYLIIAGITYITAGGDEGKAKTARTGILNAVVGIIVIMLAWGIINFLSSRLVPS